jgi:hypothetical protein
MNLINFIGAIGSNVTFYWCALTVELCMGQAETQLHHERTHFPASHEYFPRTFYSSLLRYPLNNASRILFGCFRLSFHNQKHMVK